jgi:hypothetical protein
LQIPQRDIDGPPDDLRINAVVVVGKQVTQPGDLVPGHRWLTGQQIGRQRLNCLADDEEPIQQSIERDLFRIVIPRCGCSLECIDRPLCPGASIADVS